MEFYSDPQSIDLPGYWEFLELVSGWLSEASSAQVGSAEDALWKLPLGIYTVFPSLPEVTLSISPSPQRWEALIMVESSIGQAYKIRLASIFPCFLIEK